jgi:hypothetical protein
MIHTMVAVMRQHVSAGALIEGVPGAECDLRLAGTRAEVHPHDANHRDGAIPGRLYSGATGKQLSSCPLMN